MSPSKKTCCYCLHRIGEDKNRISFKNNEGKWDSYFIVNCNIYGSVNTKNYLTCNDAAFNSERCNGRINYIKRISNKDDVKHYLDFCWRNWI